MSVDTHAVRRRSRRQVARSRGAVSGLLLIILGAWGALIPFIGPYFDYRYTTDSEWTWTSARGWLEVLPGAVTAVAGLLLLVSSRRVGAMFASWLAILAGAWFAVGTSLASLLHIGSIGAPVSTHESVRSLESIGMFYGLGVVIVFFGAVALGRLSVRTVGDVRYAERTLEAEAAAPAVAEPVAAEPVATERVAAEPVAAERVAEPVATERVADERVADERVADEQIADRSARQPVVDEPAGDRAPTEPVANEVPASTSAQHAYGRTDYSDPRNSQPVAEQADGEPVTQERHGRFHLHSSR